MKKEIAICINSDVFENPSLIGLNKQILLSGWLSVFTNADDFRRYIKNNISIKESWIYSSDNIEAINLAAAIKADNEECIVCLISQKQSGSLSSRAKQANIDSILSLEQLRERISAKEKIVQNSNEKNHRIKFNSIPKQSIDISKTNKAFVLSVLSASGGSGKSSICAMVGILCHLAGFKTLVIDADFQFGDMTMIFNDADSVSISDLIENRGAVGKLKNTKMQPSLIAAPESPELAEKIIEEFPAILESFRSIYDVIVVNTGSLWNEQQAILLERDSKSLFVIDQRPSSINAAKKAMDLCNRCGIPTNSLCYILNKCSKKSIFTSVDISYAFGGANVAEILDGGIDVEEYMSTGVPYELVQARNPFALSIWSLLENILPKELLENRKMDLKNKRKIRKSVKNSKKSGIAKFLNGQRA